MDSKRKEENLQKNLTAVKELAHILATKDQYVLFGYRGRRQDAERMVRRLKKGLNGEFNFEFKDIVDKEENEEQKKLYQLWEKCCRELGFDIAETHDRGHGWVARPRRKPEETNEEPYRFLSKLQIYIKILEAYEFAAGSPDKALLLPKCVQELRRSIPRPNFDFCNPSELEGFAATIQEHVQTQSVATLQSLSTFLEHDINALVTSSPSRYIVWYSDTYHYEPQRASQISQISDRLNMISWCTWMKSRVDEVLAMRLAEDSHQHHHELKGLLQEVSSELKKLPLRCAASKSEAADVLSDASWVQFPSEIASISESSDSSTSGISVETFVCPCFMTDSVFKAPDGSFVGSQQLVKGSKVLGFDGSILTVNNPPEQHQARATVILYAAGAKLQVTPDHRVVLATRSPAFWPEVVQNIWMFSLILQ